MSDQQKELSIKTVPVEIRVLLVDGKRMTKSVFDQIKDVPSAGDIIKISPDFKKCNIIPNILGWVNYQEYDRFSKRDRKRKCLVYSIDGLLRKTFLDDIAVWFHSDDNLKNRNEVQVFIYGLLFPDDNQIFISI